MEGIVRFIKDFLGLHKRGYEYWTYTNDIKIPSKYKLSKIGSDKWNHKLNYYLKTGEFESPIILDKDFNLIDGFSSVKIAHVKGIDKVPVYFA